MELDITTFHFSSILSRIGFFIVFSVMIARSPQSRYLWYWGGALATSTAGSIMALSVPQEAMPAPLLGALMFGAYTASMALSWNGLRLFYGKPGKWRHVLTLIGLAGTSYIVLPALSVSMTTEMSALYLMAGLGAGLVIIEIYRARHERLWSQYVVAAAFLGYLLSFAIGIVLLFINEEAVTMTSAGQGPLIFDQVTSTMVYLGFIAMSSEWANQRLIEQAETDHLTGLTNRRGVARLLGAMHFSSTTSALLMLDIDYFKDINDRYGHEEGDAVLIEFAGRIRQTLKDHALIARWGGEEFLVVLTDSTPQTAWQRAEDIRRAVAGAPFHTAGGLLDVTVSIGVAITPTLVRQFDATASAADAALYQAKHNGRNRVCLSGPSQAGKVPSHPGQFNSP